LMHVVESTSQRKLLKKGWHSKSHNKTMLTPRLAMNPQST
jgi:hypothetical protein